MVQALSSNTPQKTFTDGIGSRRVIGCFEHLDATRCRNSSETGSKLAISVTNEVLWCVSVRSRLPQGLGSPSIGRRSRHTNMDHFPRLQFDAEEGKERPKEQVADLEKVTAPDIGSMVAKESRPGLSFLSRRTSLPHVLLDRSLANMNTQLEQFTTDPLSAEDVDSVRPFP